MEIWKDIKNYEGLYQVSNFGRVKSLRFKNGNCFYKREKILKLLEDKDGYFQVNLSKNNKSSTKRVHRLVAEAFLPNECEFPLINHKDENKQNNNAKNLEWCDVKYNSNYGEAPYKKGLKRSKGIKQFDLRGHYIATWVSIAMASKVLKINHANIIACLKHNRHHAGGYKWEYSD